jgi:hypothetical protein
VAGRGTSRFGQGRPEIQRLSRGLRERIRAAGMSGELMARLRVADGAAAAACGGDIWLE